MNRCRLSLNTHHLLYSKQWNTGRWAKGEDKLLREAVEAYIVKKETIRWRLVSKIVGTRDPVNCRLRWHRKLLKQSELMGYNENKEDTDNENDFSFDFCWKLTKMTPGDVKCEKMEP